MFKNKVCEEVPEEKITPKMWDSDSPDPLTRERGRCLERDCTVRKYFDELKECTERVMEKINYTAETCMQETTDLVMAVDHCVDKAAFQKLL